MSLARVGGTVSLNSLVLSTGVWRGNMGGSGFGVCVSVGGRI